MATVYNFNVRCVSAFCSYPEKDIAKLIQDALTKFVDPDTGLTLESIVVKPAEPARRMYDWSDRP